MTRRFSHTVARVPIEFEMGGEDFTAPAILSPQALGQLLDKQKDLSKIDSSGAETATLAQIQTVLADIFDLILEPESAGRVRERLASTDRAFDLQREIMPTITALIEEYTGRPTQPSSPSSNGRSDGGTSSTDGPPAVASTPSPLAVTASAI